jgi:shikimate kinase
MKIVLLGYMASGKSSIGRRLSDKINMPLIDLDDYISDKENLSIPEIFKQKGEIYFRNIEHKYVKEVLLENDNFILALGGGTPCYANNMQFINSTDATSIYLQGSTKTMIDRLIRKKAKRPLVAFLSDEQIPEFVAKHLFERRPFYEQAKVTVKIDDKKKKEVAEEIYKMLISN